MRDNWGPGIVSLLTHYDPRTNRCYVSFVSKAGDDYHHHLFDGQTGEELAWSITSVRVGEDASGFVRPDLQVLPTNDADRFKAAEAFMKRMMADDRAQ